MHNQTSFQAEVKSDHSQITNLLKNLVGRVEKLEEKRNAGPSTPLTTPQKTKIPLIIRVSQIFLRSTCIHFNAFLLFFFFV